MTMTDTEKMKQLADEVDGMADLFSELGAEPTPSAMRSKPLLECMETIVQYCRYTTHFSNGQTETGYRYKKKIPLDILAEAECLGKALGIPANLAVLFSIIVDSTEGCSLSRNRFSRELGASYVQSLKYENDLVCLTASRLISRNRSGDISVEEEAMNAIINDQPLKKPDFSGMSTLAILNRISRLFNKYSSDDGDMDRLREECDEIVLANPQTSFTRTYKAKRIDSCTEMERLLFYALCHLYHEHNYDEVEWWDVRDYFDDSELNELQVNFRYEQLKIQKLGILVSSGSDGLQDKDHFQIADAVNESLLADCGGLHGSGQQPGIVRCDTIPAKELFFDKDTEMRLGDLEQLLMPERCKEVMDALKGSGLRTGFACLFYGIPGTGKTESVYQLARRTGRDLLAVDVSQLKSKWVGESEKNLKVLFNRYRKMACDAQVAPILLFNEADAIFGLRRIGADQAVDKMENSLQNIILQEMESLEGILIATTNLTQNLDKAFERRFLYKLHFENPSDEVKARIWRSMMPDLTESDAGRLASAFNFTGGQIENILRKRTIHAILRGGQPTLDDLLGFCREEAIASENPVGRIGFRG